MSYGKKRFLLFLALVVAARSVVHGGEGDADRDVIVEEATSDSDDLLQLNPEYGIESDEDSESDSSDSGEETEDDDDEAKTALAKALLKSRKAPRRALKLVKKNQTKILVAVAMYAFRREIFLVLLHFFGSAEIDQSTGKSVRRLKIKPTTILKLVVFVELMRRIESGDSATGPGSSVAALVLGGRQGLVFMQAISALIGKASNPSFVPSIEQHYTFERINERHTKDNLAFQKSLEPVNQHWLHQKKIGASASLFGSKTNADVRTVSTYNGTVIILDVSGIDEGLPILKELSDKVSFLLNLYRDQMTNSTNTTATNADNATVVDAKLEVVITLESPGGSASDYGLAAQQILRLRDEPGITLTICCDKVAASGGYMMACTSSPGHLFAAPFAVVGSIGVVGQTLNVHDTLENWGVKPVILRGGKHKAPLGLIGEVTDDAIATVQGMIDKTHDAFKRHVLSSRPLLARQLEHVTTGEVWLGSDAIEVGLVDRVVTSDEYIGERMRDGARVLKLINYDKQFRFGPSGPLGAFVNSVSARVGELRRITSHFSNVLKEVVAGNYDELAISAASKSFGVSTIHRSEIP